MYNRPQLDDAVVGSNVRGVHCPADHAVRVESHQGVGTTTLFLHANEIAFAPAAVPARQGAVGMALRPARGEAAAAQSSDAAHHPRTTKAGQSPQNFDLCERFLLEAMQSGRGLFQFVARVTHHTPELSRERSVMGQLRAEYDRLHESDQTLTLGGRYKVLGLQPLAGGPDHRCMRVHVRDLHNPGNACSIMLTQAALPYTNGLLRIEQIERADALYRQHERVNRAQMPATEGVSGGEQAAPAVVSPMVVSYAGVGRNAALIAYREVKARFDEAKQTGDLDSVIESVVLQGRQARGPRFIQTKEQLNELRQALYKAYFEMHGAMPGAGERGSSADAADVSAVSDVADVADVADVSDVSDVADAAGAADAANLADVASVSHVADEADAVDLDNATVKADAARVRDAGDAPNATNPADGADEANATALDSLANLASLNNRFNASLRVNSTGTFLLPGAESDDDEWPSTPETASTASASGASIGNLLEILPESPEAPVAQPNPRQRRVRFKDEPEVHHYTKSEDE